MGDHTQVMDVLCGRPTLEEHFWLFGDDKEAPLPSDEKNDTDIMPSPPPTDTPIIVK